MEVSKLLVLLALLLFRTAFAQVNGNFTNLIAAFPLLKGFDAPLGRSPRLGGQNFTQCCLKAFNQALTVAPNGSVVGSNNSTFLSNNINPVIDNLLNKSQFPCGATYQGDRRGVNPVTVPWSWCMGNCGGWQISQSTSLNQWVQPFVGFILPSVIFVLSVPRRRKLHLPNWVFPPDIDNIRAVKAVFCAIAAALVVSIDTIVWLGIVFALTGPFLLSGVYEAFMDKEIADFMTEKIKNGHLPLALRARILLAILVGNLDLDSAWAPSMKLANCLETSRGPGGNPSIDRNASSIHTDDTAPTHPSTATRVSSMAELQPAHPIPTQQHLDLTEGAPREPRDSDIELQVFPNISREDTLDLSIEKVKTRLKSMLACQYSFGSTVGAPVIFYMGSFIYTLLEINAALGDTDTANALAFGTWWMSIPHVSIVSGCLLAGNNPNTLEAITPNRGDAPSTRTSQRRIAQLYLNARPHLIEPTYEAKYYPATMLERGRSKREWAMKLAESYHKAAPRDMREFRERISMSWGDWTMILICALILLFVPCVSGMITAYYTPQVGLSCRSMTFLVYACSQVLLSALWIWNITWRDKDWRRRMALNAAHTKFRLGSIAASGDGAVPEDGEPQKSSNEGVTKLRWFRRALRSMKPSDPNLLNYKPSHLCSVVFWFLVIMGLITAIFTAIGGALMQIIGVYRNCLCKISVQHWLDKQMDMVLSTNNHVDIEAAVHFWLRTGAGATGFLGLICYIGWWYQRRLRFRFRGLVNLLDDNLPSS